MLPGQFDRQFYAMDRGRKTGDEKSPLSAGKYFVKLAADGAFAGSVAFALDVSGILEQSEHAFFAVFGEGMKVEQSIVGGSGVDLEVAGVNNDSQRRMDGQCDTIHQAVSDGDGVDGKRADLEALAGPNLVQLSVIEKTMLVEFVLDIGEGKLGAPDRHVELGKNPGQGADVVFVAVSEDDGAHLLAIFGEVRNVRNDDVDAEQFGFREHEAGVDDDNVVTPAHSHAVHSELTEPAQGHNMQFSSWHWGSIDASTGVRAE